MFKDFDVTLLHNGNKVHDSCVGTFLRQIDQIIFAYESASSVLGNPETINLEAVDGKLVITFNSKEESHPEMETPVKKNAVDRDQWVEEHLEQLDDDLKGIVKILCALTPADEARERKFELAKEIAEHNDEEIPDFD